MSLNIEDEEACRLIQELAQLTGESVEAAVNSAVKEKLERQRSPQEQTSGLAERLMEIARETAPLLKEPWKSIDHGDLLYDEKGLPK